MFSFSHCANLGAILKDNTQGTADACDIPRASELLRIDTVRIATCGATVGAKASQVKSTSVFCSGGGNRLES